MSLRMKFALAISLTIAVALAVSMGFYYFSGRQFHEDAMQRQNEAVVDSLAKIAEEGLLVNDDLLVQNFTEYIKRANPNVDFCYVVSADGTVLAHSDKKHIGAKADGLKNPGAGSDVLSRELSHQYRGDFVVVGFSRNFAAREMADYTNELLSGVLKTFIITMLLGYIVAYLMAVSLTRPIEKIAMALKSAGEGDMDVRLELRRNDEIGYLADEFNSMLGRLKEFERMKYDFVSAVTHELKSPLSAIESYLELMLYELKSQYLPHNKFEEDIKYIKNNTFRLSRFISDVLDIAKIRRGRFDIKKAPFVIETLAWDVLTLFKERADFLKISLAGPPEGSSTRLRADEERLRQVLTNLISNAIKFTPEGGTVSVAVASSDGTATIAVKDTGVGIAPADMNRIFGLFEQGKTAVVHSKSPKGTGLGLYIAKSIVEAHGCKIWVESQLGAGTSIYFTAELAPRA
ncbi:MAG: ATP-binding protein [Elusimicrobiales bacterium]